MYEPNTPLTSWRWDKCHLKQQAGHGRIIVCIGQDTEKPISRVADYASTLRHYFQQKNQLEL